MTTLNLDQNEARYQIRAYKPGMIKINDQVFEQSVIISANDLITDWLPQCVDDLNEEAFKIILQRRPNILLIGTGEKHHLLSPKLYGELLNADIGVEVMNTGAACRTYNALTSENRDVCAALLIY